MLLLTPTLSLIVSLLIAIAALTVVFGPIVLAIAAGVLAAWVAAIRAIDRHERLRREKERQRDLAQVARLRARFMETGRLADLLAYYGYTVDVTASGYVEITDQMRWRKLSDAPYSAALVGTQRVKLADFYRIEQEFGADGATALLENGRAAFVALARADLPVSAMLPPEPCAMLP